MMFYKVSDILQCHQLFQISLAQAVEQWDDTECIGETFVASFSKSMVLECYGAYINNFPVAMETVRKTCVRKPQFLAFLKRNQEISSSRVNLYGLMLKLWNMAISWLPVSCGWYCTLIVPSSLSTMTGVSLLPDGVVTWEVSSPAEWGTSNLRSNGLRESSGRSCRGA